MKQNITRQSNHERMSCRSRLVLAAVEDKTGVVHRIVDRMTAVARHREVLDLDSRLGFDREAAEEVASIDVAAGHIHQVQAIDSQRFGAAGNSQAVMP